MLGAVHEGACAVCDCVGVHMLQQDLSHGSQQRLEASLLPLQAVHVHVQIGYDAHQCTSLQYTIRCRYGLHQSHEAKVHITA